MAESVFRFLTSAAGFSIWWLAGEARVAFQPDPIWVHIISGVGLTLGIMPLLPTQKDKTDE